MEAPQGGALYDTAWVEPLARRVADWLGVPCRPSP
jgi:hypothetical protein